MEGGAREDPESERQRGVDTNLLGRSMRNKFPAKLPQSACHVRLGNVGAFAETPFGMEQIGEN